ncbi:hypothetical protein COO91_00987 [Nostoc flagelliforme CCNUN1]|uniref:Uncharacterized protein n=1 Tax=Nostoc flagelliforme CCNUN1 TaxID=2038116 RepID=A0A2K8SI66_9NOSO|nr:hypothetical protein [Nostoc flagelliforme]AUB35128.1 hypothetical protein COO91_00987 [Nostoc flagelliforme CCNUN1]
MTHGSGSGITPMPPIQLFVRAFTGYEIVNTPALPLGWLKGKG